MEDELLTLVKAAEVAGCSAPTLSRAIRLGKLAGKKFGNTWLVTRQALDEWLKSGGYHPAKKRW